MAVREAAQDAACVVGKSPPCVPPAALANVGGKERRKQVIDWAKTTPPAPPFARGGKWRAITAMLLEMRDVSKSFGATRALESVSLGVDAGEVRALIGENGAGKSTLVKILSGAYQPDSGSMSLAGAAYAPVAPRDALRAAWP